MKTWIAHKGQCDPHINGCSTGRAVSKQNFRLWKGHPQVLQISIVESSGRKGSKNRSLIYFNNWSFPARDWIFLTFWAWAHIHLRTVQESYILSSSVQYLRFPNAMSKIIDIFSVYSSFLVSYQRNWRFQTVLNVASRWLGSVPYVTTSLFVPVFFNTGIEPELWMFGSI